MCPKSMLLNILPTHYGREVLVGSGLGGVIAPSVLTSETGP
jgi:hypothetical protein